MIATTKHRLTFGALDWKGLPDPAGWRMHALAEGASLGNAVPVEQALAHQLLDGSITGRKRYDNRTATFDVLIVADDSIALNKGAAALDLACDNPSTLRFTPPDGLGAATVFEVVSAKAEWLFDDLDELRNQRRFRVTINCLPFGRSAEPVTDTVAAVDAPAAEQTVNACDSLTGWTGLNGSTAVLDTSVKYQGTGSIKATGQARTVTGGGETATRVTETGTWELTGLSLTTPETRPFISFKAYVGDSVSFTATLRVNGEAADFVSVTRPDASWALFTFRTYVTDTITTLRFSERITGSFASTPVGSGKDITWVPSVPSSWAPRIDDVLRNGAASALSRQSLRAIPVEGSARTQGSLAVAHPTNGLGKVLLLTTPALASGFTPDLMKWCTGTTSNDTGSISGKVGAFSNTSTPVPFQLPAALVPPGSYQLIGFMETGALTDDFSASAAIVVTASTKVGSVTLSTKTYQQRIEPTGDGVFDFVDCGPITLPTTNVPAGSDAVVRLTISPGRSDFLTQKAASSAYGSSFQDFYLIPLVDDTALNIFDCGGTGTAAIGTANNRLWLDSADLSSRFPSAWMGTSEDRTDAYHAAGGAVRWQPLSLEPPEVLLFMANSGGANATATMTHTPSWHGLAAK